MNARTKLKRADQARKRRAELSKPKDTLFGEPFHTPRQRKRLMDEWNMTERELLSYVPPTQYPYVPERKVWDKVRKMNSSPWDGILSRPK
jgi:hypothetical protein